MGFAQLGREEALYQGAYHAYADNEIGRVIQAVEDLGELDNTLIIYIGGDNGASAVKDQFLWYPFWGSERTYPHFAAGWAWALIFARRGGISAFPPLLRWYRRPRSRG